MWSSEDINSPNPDRPEILLVYRTPGTSNTCSYRASESRSRDVESWTRVKEAAVRRRHVLALVVSITLAGSGTIATPARAGLEIYQQATESMMNSEGLIMSLVARDLGIDPTVSLNFTSAMDPVAQTFSYSLQSGSMYLGRSAALQVSGAFDVPSQSWLFTSTGHIGATSLAGNGSTTFSGDPMSFDIFVPLTFDETIISNVTYDNTAIRTASTGTITVKDSITGAVKSSGTHTDTLIITGPDQGKWMWDTGMITTKDGKPFTVDAAGFIPVPNGGAGTFIVQVAAVPEPSTFALVVVFGAIGLGGACARRKRIAWTAAGLSRVVRPHGLRHGSITKALDLTRGNLRDVAVFSRHRKSRTLQVYDDR